MEKRSDGMKGRLESPLRSKSYFVNQNKYESSKVHLAVDNVNISILVRLSDVEKPQI